MTEICPAFLGAYVIALEGASGFDMGGRIMNRYFLLSLSVALLIGGSNLHAAEPAAEHLALAKKVVVQAGTVETAKQGFWLVFQPNLDAMEAGGLSADAIAEIREAAEKFIDSVFADGRFVDGIAKIYTEKFTGEELQQLIAFNETPLGQKLNKELPSVMAEGAAMGEKLAGAETAKFEAKVTEIIKASQESPSED